MKVLVVDDSKLVCDRIRSYLYEHSGIEMLEEVDHSQGAQAAIESVCPDLVILDIRLPDGNGINLLKKIKEYRSSTAVIVFTQFPFPAYRQKCEEYGADYFYDKSTEFQSLILQVVRLSKVLKSGRNFSAHPPGKEVSSDNPEN